MPEGLGFVRGVPILPGDVIWVRGANGTGKTALLRSLAGLPHPLQSAPQSAPPSGPSPHAKPQKRGPTPSPAAHLVMQDPRDGLVGLTVAGEFRLRRQTPPTGMARLLARPVATLSSGETRQTALAAGASSRHPLLLLDEPAEGLDAQGRRHLLAIVKQHSARGAVVATDHSGILAKLATRVVDLGEPPPSPPLRLAPPGRTPVVHASGFRHPWSPTPFPALALPAGLHALVGANGSGKSTWLRALAGLDSRCTVHVNGVGATPGHNVRLLLPRAREAFRHETVAATLQDARTEPAKWGVASLLGRHPWSLSGGEAQRVALAKALAPAPLHLLDEPEAHLDAAGRALLHKALSRRVTAGACVIVATHDPDLMEAAHTRIPVGEA